MIITTKDDDLTIIPYSIVQKIKCEYANGFGSIDVSLPNGEITIFEYDNSNEKIAKFVYYYCRTKLVGSMVSEINFNVSETIKEALESYKQGIEELIGDTVKIIDRLKTVYNFKAK